MNRLAVVILNWNGIDDTLLCFDSLLKQTASNFTIVIVDNGSVDNSKETLKKLQSDHSDQLVVLYNSYNKGFAGGVNTGITWALKNDFRAVALFNNDAVADKRWLESLDEASKDGQVGIVTGLLLHSDGKTIDSTGEQYTTWGLPFPRGRDLATGTAQAGGYTFGATGGATLYKMSVFKDVGLFDEDFFAY
jgi:GT2 family glycosyltransferase